MSQDITPFEQIRRTNPAGNEFWSSRDFAKVLGYVNYRHFEAVIAKAKTACFNSGQRIEDHFVGSDQMVEIGSGAQRQLKTVMMSRYAGYLVIQNADPAKEIVAQGQTYFAIQTRRQELSDEEMEEQRRLAIRSDLRTHNSQLADAAKDAGVIESRDYAIFQNHGYMGLYGGLGAQDIHRRKGLKKGEQILDHMGSTELAANLFRATQAEDKLRREQITGKDKANQAHREVGPSRMINKINPSKRTKLKAVRRVGFNWNQCGRIESAAMNRQLPRSFAWLVGAMAAPLVAATPAILSPVAVHRYVENFNRHDHTHFGQAISNEVAADWMANNVPLFECPDQDIEEIYHFRWWTFRKHIKQTTDGFVITEFLPQVPWSGKHNTIPCPAGHHFREGRWIRNPKYLNDYAVFWFRKGGAPRSYSFWAADSLLQRAMTLGNFDRAIDLLPDLITNYEQWEKTHLEPDGLFWQIDDRDGMEASVGGRNHRGEGKRPTINSYMYGDAAAIATIAAKADKPDIATIYQKKAGQLRQLILKKLWDDKAKFFKVLPRQEGAMPVDVRELHGYTPWYFGIPPQGQGYEVAWKQLIDPQAFLAPFGPTTTERRHPGFSVSYEGHECQWNGPSWPFATAITLTALANVLNDYPQQSITRRDYFETLKTYTKSQHLKREDGTIVPWIDENLNPDTGDWIARTRLKSWKDGMWDAGKGGIERGKDYNHSTYCDLIITGLIGLRPQADDTVVVNPLLPDDTWDYFCLDGLPYHGRTLTICYDKTGQRYGMGRGLRLLADGKEIGARDSLGILTTK